MLEDNASGISMLTPTGTFRCHTRALIICTIKKMRVNLLNVVEECQVCYFFFTGVVLFTSKLTHCFFSQKYKYIVKGLSTPIKTIRLQKVQEAEEDAKYKDDSLEHQNAEAYANLISMLTTEVNLYPFETIFHRIHRQFGHRLYCCANIDKLSRSARLLSYDIGHRRLFWVV